MNVLKLATKAMAFANRYCGDANEQIDEKKRGVLFSEKLADLVEKEVLDTIVKVWYEQGLDHKGADLHQLLKRYEELTTK